MKRSRSGRRRRRASTGWLVGLALAAGVGGCAAPRSRGFVRSGVESVRLRTLDVVALAAEPGRPDALELELEPFDAPTRGPPLNDARPIWTEGSARLAEATRAALEARGFRVRVIEGAGALGLTEALAAAQGDALLVVRAVPLVDPLVRVDEVEAQILDLGGGGQVGIPQQVGETERRAGELWLGQMFLYARERGVRLWSRQLPGWPADGTLSADAPLFDYGWLTPRGEAPPPRARIRDRAARRFVDGTLRGFLATRDGDPGGAGVLAAVDPVLEERRQRFFDQTHLAIDVGSRWSLEQIGASAGLPNDEATLPDLGAGDLAPYGGVGLVDVRGSLVVPGGLSFDAYATYGVVPGARFDRRVFREAELGGPDVLGTQSAEGGAIFGGGLGLGRVWWLGPSLALHPAGLVFVEQWSYDVGPSTVFPQGDHVRSGAEARLDLWWTPSGGPFLLRVGGHGRAGIDTAGPAFLGGGASAGVGALF